MSEQSFAGLLAKQHGVGEIGRQQPGRQLPVALQLLLRGEQPGRDHHRVEAVQLPLGLIECRAKLSGCKRSQ